LLVTCDKGQNKRNEAPKIFHIAFYWDKYNQAARYKYFNILPRQQIPTH
jgi:hypothetical protein